MNKDNLTYQRIISVTHWNETLLSFKCTRAPGFRFQNGQFVMIGLTDPEGNNLMRAYSIVSPNWEEYLEFLSIKIPDGKLTSKLQKIKKNDTIIIGKKPTGTLILDDLEPGQNLYLISSGTGIAPFMSIVQDPETYNKFEKIILCHSVRYTSELVYRSLLTEDLAENEFFGNEVSDKLIYYPTTTRDFSKNQGRLTELMRSGKLFEDIGFPIISGKRDRAMLCGSPQMLFEMAKILSNFGLKASPRIHQKGDFLVERAFVEK